MENKLEQLTQKLYNEGLEKGRTEADALTAAAKEQAAKIVADAQAKADEIIKKAQQKADDTAKNTQTEIELAGRQSMNTLKQQIEEMVLTRTVDPAIKSALEDASFIKTILVEVAKNWNSQGGKVELNTMLPEAMKAEFEKAVQQAAAGELDGIEVGYNNSVTTGFKVAPRNGGFYINFSEESFQALVKEYLRPHVAQMLFEQAK